MKAPDRTSDDVIAELAVHDGMLRVVESIATKLGVPIEDITGRRRLKSIVRARHLAWYELRRQFKCSYPELGEIWGCDHTSVMYGVHKVSGRMKQLPLFEAA